MSVRSVNSFVRFQVRVCYHLIRQQPTLSLSLLSLSSPTPNLPLRQLKACASSSSPAALTLLSVCSFIFARYRSASRSVPSYMAQSRPSPPFACLHSELLVSHSSTKPRRCPTARMVSGHRPGPASLSNVGRRSIPCDGSPSGDAPIIFSLQDPVGCRPPGGPQFAFDAPETSVNKQAPPPPIGKALSRATRSGLPPRCRWSRLCVSVCLCAPIVVVAASF